MKTLEVMEKVLKGKRLKANTQRHYREALGSLAQYSEDWPVSGVIINEWLASLEGYADSTIKMWFDCVNAAGKYVLKAYKIANPCAEAERPKVSKKRRRYFTVDEMVAIIKACVNDFELALVMTLIDSACRIGELVDLRGGDVGDGFINVAGKTGQRRYRLDVRLCEKLRDMAGGEDKPVFKNRFGRFYQDGDGLGHRVRYIVERAGIKGKKIGVHTIRHSSASLVASVGMKPLVVKALLQHDDVNTSMVYIHDVEDLIIGTDEYSPLKLVEKRYKEAHSGEVEGEQLRLSDGQFGDESVALVPVSGEVVDAGGVDVLVSDMFPEIPDGIVVRTLLKYEELMLVRKIFMWYASYNPGNSDAARVRELMKRMLRKGGSEFYAKRQ
ncbi:MAG: tyrosine-type recombinase/integrase [Dehalococcoidia bacterium]